MKERKRKMNNIIYMKYGVHAGETVDSIVRRKQEEVEKVGYTFWGYGGNFCHPLTQVQPFAEGIYKKGEKLYLVMSLTESKLNNEPHKSSYLSIDKKNWSPIDERINVLGSKFALCIKDLKVCDFDLSLSTYSVGIGNKSGTILSDYIRYRVDKACAVNNGSSNNYKTVQITLIAEVIAPFAVFTK